ncbi:MAG: hypothetical protein IJA10_12360 [Lachnospiraceae bacterium]|nr:hypothetical protein [Lachnospiraceae bacterium]
MLDAKDIEILRNVIGEVVDSRIEKIDSRLENIEARLENVEARLENIETDISNIQSTIEHELRPNITIIAEGHWSLNRKLDEIFKIRDQHELVLIRLNRLENELLKTK